MVYQILLYFLLAKVRKPWQSGQYTVYLWEFLYGLLQDPECCSLITWTNKESKEFRIKNTHEIATLWGTVKNRPRMDDKKLLRALRYYYKTKILRKVRTEMFTTVYFYYFAPRFLMLYYTVDPSSLRSDFSFKYFVTLNLSGLEKL